MMADQVVHLVLSPTFQGDLWSLSRSSHVWLQSSESNDLAARDVWARDTPEQPEGAGVTTFEGGDDQLASLYAYLSTIDEHHPDWISIRVIGVTLVETDPDRVASALECDLTLDQIAGGFTIGRRAQQADASGEAEDRQVDSTKTIAEAFSRALIDELVPNQEVVAWVDSVIMSTEEPHSALLDASLSVSDRNALLSSLHELPGHIEPLQVLKRHMGYMLRALLCDPTKAQAIARSLYATALNGDASGSAMEGPMWAFDDDLDLARAGYFGDVEAITSELTAFLAEHASAV